MEAAVPSVCERGDEFKGTRKDQDMNGHMNPGKVFRSNSEYYSKPLNTYSTVAMIE